MGERTHILRQLATQRRREIFDERTADGILSIDAHNHMQASIGNGRQRRSSVRGGWSSPHVPLRGAYRAHPLCAGRLCAHTTHRTRMSPGLPLTTKLSRVHSVNAGADKMASRGIDAAGATIKVEALQTRERGGTPHVYSSTTSSGRSACTGGSTLSAGPSSSSWSSSGSSSS